MLLLVAKGIRGGICCAIYQYMKANNKYMKDKNKELSYLKYWDVSNFYGRIMLKKVPEGSYKQTENKSQFSKQNLNSNNKMFPMKNLDKIPTLKPASTITVNPTVFDTPKRTKAQTKL